MQAYFLHILSTNAQLDLKDQCAALGGEEKSAEGFCAAGARVPAARGWAVTGTRCQPEPRRFGSARPRC